MHFERGAHAMCYFDSCLVVVGGNSNEDILDKCEVYNFN